MSTADEPAEPRRELEALGIMARPPFQLRTLPIAMRWEVTRRHPYYQMWWRLAHDHHQNAAARYPDDPREPFFRNAAVAILSGIGVSGDPPDPALSFDQAFGGDNLQPGWLSGAVHPISFRGLLGICLASLPQATLVEIGRLFTAASLPRSGDTLMRVELLGVLSTVDWEGLNDFPNEPFVSINPAASARQINESIHDLCQQWRDERGLSERRNRPDVFHDYLRVWDLREGWENGTYEPSLERLLREVAAELQVSSATVNNQYRSAFQLITGHDYSPALWCRVFGPLKLTGPWH